MSSLQTVFYNGKIWQKDAKKLSTWFKVSGKKVVDYGDSSNLPNVCKMVDLKHKWVFPGFHDCHLHVHLCGLKTNVKKYFGNSKSIEDLKNKLQYVVNQDKSDKWFVGYGWDDEVMGRIPTREVLDEIVTTRPILLYRTCYHIAVVNSKALKLSKLEAGEAGLEVYPTGHRHSGELNGILKEMEQISRVVNNIPKQTCQEKKEDILSTLNVCLENGITSVHPQDAGCWQAYKELAEDGLLPISCHLAPSYLDMDTDNFPSSPVKSMGRLKTDTVKVFIDGALRANTAALSQPYINTEVKNNFGVLQSSEEELKNIIDKINKRGFRLEIHTIGDRAAEVALNCLESCSVPSHMRPIFVHCQILREDLIERMYKHGVVSSVQPSFAPHDYNFVKNHLPVELYSHAYVWKTLIKKGVPIGGSSDAPVEDLNPLQGIHDAVFRETEDGEVFNEKEVLSFDEAVELYTKSSAFVDGVEDHKGQIEKGFDADFVILETPLNDKGYPSDLSDNPRLILKSKVCEVWVEGELSYKTNT